MNQIQRATRAVDRLQQHHTVLAFLFALNKKYGDDRGGQLTYYGFLTLFPLLLLLVTILGLVAGADPSLAHRIEHSAFAQ